MSATPSCRKERNNVSVYRAWIIPKTSNTQVGLSDRAARTDGKKNPRHGRADTTVDNWSGVMLSDASSCLREMLDVAVRMYHIALDRPVGKMKFQNARNFNAQDNLLVDEHEVVSFVLLFGVEVLC